MSRAPFVVCKSDAAFSRSMKMEDTTMGWRFVNPLMKAKYGTDTMPETGDIVAEEYKISRCEQDKFALRSPQRAAAAMNNGNLAEEIVAVPLPQKKGAPLSLAVDEHPRPDTTLEGLAKLKGVVKPEGTVTAGNASGINDGACAVLLASEAGAKRHGLKPRARVVAAVAAGIEPRIMGMGPVPATRKLMEKTKLSVEQMSVIELNEAFSSQSLAVLRELEVADALP
jgi:acetyl-CoA acyltransferase